MGDRKEKGTDNGEGSGEPKGASEHPAAFHITEADEAVLDGATAPESLVQFLLATLRRALPLNNDQIKALLSSNRPYLSHILVKGVQGNFSALEEWFQALQEGLPGIEGALTADLTATCRTCSIFRSGLRSRSGALAGRALSLLEAVLDTVSQDEAGASAMKSWFRNTEEGGSGVLVSLAACARMHGALRKQALELGLKGVGDAMDLLLNVLPRSGPSPIKRLSMQVAWVEHLAADAAMRARAKESKLPLQLLLFLVQQARQRGLDGAHHVALLDAVSRLLALFPTATAFSTHGLIQAGDAFAAALSLPDPGRLASVASALCCTIECLVEGGAAKESLPAFFRPCLVSLLSSVATPSLRRHWCFLFPPLLERLPEAPVGALVAPYTHQLILRGYGEHDLHMLSALLKHPRCGVKEGEHIASFTAQVAINDTVYGRTAALPLIMAIVRFQQAPNVVAVVIALCRVALTILTDEHTPRNRNKVAERCELAMEVLARIFVLGIPTVNLPCQRLIATARSRWVEMTQGDLDPLVGGLHHLVKRRLYRKPSEPGRAAWSDKREEAVAAADEGSRAAAGPRVTGRAHGSKHPAVGDADMVAQAMSDEALAFRAATPTRLTRERETIMGPSPAAKATTVASREEEIQQYAEQRRKQREAAAEKERRQQEIHDPPSELREQLMSHFFAVANEVKRREEQELLGSMLQSVSRAGNASEGEEDTMSEVFDSEWTPNEGDGGVLNLYQLLNKRAAVEMFKPWAKPLRRAFRSYARAHDGNTQSTFADLKEAHSTMNISELLLFLKDFDLLPIHVSREEATRLFWRVTTAMGAIARGRGVPAIIRSKKKGEMSHVDLLACLRVIAMRGSFPGPPHESGRATAMAKIMRDACERANQRMLEKGGGECRQGPVHVWKAGSTREKLLERWNTLLKEDPRALLPPGVEREVSKVYEAPSLLPEAHAAALEALDLVVHKATGGAVHLLVPRLVTRVEMSSFREYMALENKPAPKLEKTVPQHTRLYPTPPRQRASRGPTERDTSPKRVVFGKLYKPPEAFTNAGGTPSPQRRYRFGEATVEGQIHARRPLARFIVGILASVVETVESGEAKEGLLARHSFDETKGDHISQWVPLPGDSGDGQPREQRPPKLKEVMKQNEDGELEALRPRLTEMARPLQSRLQTKAEERKSKAEQEREQHDKESRKALKQRREELRKKLEAQKEEKEKKEKEEQVAAAERRRKKLEREKAKQAEKAREREAKKALLAGYREKLAQEEAKKKEEEAENAKRARAERRRMQELAKKRREAALRATQAQLEEKEGADAESGEAQGTEEQEEMPAADGPEQSPGANRQMHGGKRKLTEEERERRVRERRTKLAAKARKTMAWRAEQASMMIEDRLGHELREQWLAEEESARKQRRLERYMARRQREVKRLVLQRRAKEEEERKQRARQARERARAGRGQEDGRVGALSYASDEGATAEEWYGSVDDEVAKDHPGEGLRSPRSPDPEAGTGEEGWTDQDAGLWTGEDTPRSDYGGSQEPGTPTHPRAVSDSGRSGRSVEDGETKDGAHHLGEDASDDEGAGSRDGALQEKDSGDEASRIDDIEGGEGGDGDDGASSDASVEEGKGVAGSNSRSGAGAGNEAAEGEVVAGPDGKDEAWQVSTEAELPSLEGEETGGDVGEVGPPSSSTSPRPAGAPKEDLSGGPSPPPSL